LEAAGLGGARAPAGPPGMARPGRSLLPLAGAAGAPAETSYFEALSATFNRGWAPLRGVLRQGHKLVALPLPELYDLPHDPGEVHNLVTSDRQLARLLLARLPRQSAWPAPTAGASGSTPIGARGEPSAAESANLRSLGYAGGS